jgi:hypothetical protein
MSIPKELSTISEADLLGLIEQPVLENKSTEYKELLNLHGDDAKRDYPVDAIGFGADFGGCGCSNTPGKSSNFIGGAS